MLINRHFKKSKIFNRNNVKVSYSCMLNIAAKERGHNKQQLQEETSQECNYRVKAQCPLACLCQITDLVYEMWAITEQDDAKKCIGGSRDDIQS